MGFQQASVGLVTGLRPELRGGVGLRMGTLAQYGYVEAWLRFLVDNGGDRGIVVAGDRRVVLGSIPIE